MTRDKEHEFYARPENQVPQGPVQRRRSRPTEMVPVRFALETLEEVRDPAEADDRSVPAWIRCAVEHELERRGAGGVSNDVSNEPRRMGTDDAGRRGAAKAADLHQRARRRIKPDERGRRKSGS